jgi:hypothetical protein
VLASMQTIGSGSFARNWHLLIFGHLQLKKLCKFKNILNPLVAIMLITMNVLNYFSSL